MSFATDAKALKESGLLTRLASWDLVVVETHGEECYCYCLEDMLLAYPGLKGFGSFVRSYQGARVDSTPLEQFNEKITQDLMIISFGDGMGVMRKYPLQDPQPLEDTVQAGDICRALLAAKPVFDQYPAKAAWCEANHLAGEVENWAPKVSLEGKVGVCEASKLDLSTDWAVATLRDGDVVGKLVQKRQPDTLVKVSTFVCPLPLGPKYPMAQLLYDGTKKTPINAFMVDDFDKEHTSFVDHFISYCAHDGVPGAMVCRDERAYYLYQEVARVLGFKIALDRGADQEMDAVSEGYVHAMAEMMRHPSEEHHGRDHAQGCHCHDHMEKGCRCHDHEGEGCGCHHHDHESGHCHCHE
jgi:hypothetical protein